MSPQTRECPGCKHPVNAAVPVCPFCGARAVGVAPGGGPARVAAGRPAAVLTAPPVAASSRPAPAAGTAGTATSSKRAAPADPSAAAAVPVCPRCCSAPAGRRPLRVQSWKQVPYWNPGVRKFRVLSADIPGPCEPCARELAVRRWAAGATLIFPFLAGALLAGFSGTASAVIVGVYGLYLVRAGSYGWADRLLYGSALEIGAADRIPRFADHSDVRVRFPGGIVHAAVRLGIAATLGFILAFVGFAAGGGRHRGPPPLSDVEVLSRVKVVYFPVDAATARWRVEEVDGARAAVGYSVWENVPSGPAEQLSPQAAFDRARQDPALEVVVLDPGPERMVVPRADFERMRLHLPPWPTPAKPVTRR